MAGDIKENIYVVNVEELMKTVKAKMDGKVAHLALSGPHKPSDASVVKSQSSLSKQGEENLSYLQGNWQVNNDVYTISSHRPLVGPILVRSRQLVNGEVKRYIDPVITRQSEINLRTVGILKELHDSIGNAADAKQVTIQIDALRTDVLNEFYGANENLEKRLAKEIRGVESVLRESLIASTDIDYYQFEERFRGTTADIRQRQSRFLEYFAGCKNVLDIGCGRGEFLGLLKEYGIIARGIDVDDGMLEYCLSHGLDVVKADAVSYLCDMEDDSLDGIFIDQVVEHLKSHYLIELLQLCYRKLKDGSHLFIETVNPVSFTSMANFYIDLTHQRPIHPETIKYLLEGAGFKDLRLLFSSPVTDGRQLTTMDPDLPEITAVEAHMIKVYNENIGKLNSILYGPQDYAIIGKK